MNVAVKTEALSIFALLLSAPGGFLPLDKDLSWMTQGGLHHHSSTKANSPRGRTSPSLNQPQLFSKTTVAQRSRCGGNANRIERNETIHRITHVIVTKAC
jgi:hypothetical protein